MNTVDPVQMKVVIGIVEKDGKVLLIRRTVKSGDLSWSFPGGKIETTDNSEEYAVKREIREETNINCSPKTCLGSRIHPDTKVSISYWRCTYVAGKSAIQNPNEIAEIRWVFPESVTDYITTDLFAPVRNMLEKLLKDNISFG